MRNLMFYSRIQGGLFLVLLMFYHTNGKASSYAPEMDSTHADKKIRFVLQVAERNSFINSKHISLISALIGFQYKKRHQFTVGIFTLPFWNKPVGHIVNDTITETSKLSWFFPCVGYNYILFNNHRFKITIPTELGYGFVTGIVTLDWPKHEVKVQRTANFIPAQLGLYAEWKTTKWVGLHVSSGYRKMLFQNYFSADGIMLNYDGFYYYYGMSLYLHPIEIAIKDMLRKHK